MSTLLRDVIDIPERAGAEDYVLRLTDSVGTAAAAQTLDAYVVTSALVEAFDTALGEVELALSSRLSRGAFLAGTFGSGKSHFMAVLHAILRHDPAARSKPELQPVIARHDPALQGKRFLPLAFHLLGAESLEQALFSGYLRQVRELHPDAALPAVHRTDDLFRDADGLRETMGDEAFFDRLNARAGGDDVWSGVLGGAGVWDDERYASARAAAPESALRLEVVNALVDTYFGSFARQAGYVDLDTGLAAIAEHAKTLGYDAVVLFLDELVLWLAFAVRDQQFFRREAQKLTKLVESGVGHRAVPLISFVARQLDLRRWFADAGASGAEQESLDRAFRHQDDRFRKIVLGDDNLPYVAAQRLLKPKDPTAAAVLTSAFARIDRRPGVWDVLLDGLNTDERHRGSDEAAFRQTYPFSPVLVSTLRSLAGVMQRERTALKVMQQMLVDGRDRLSVDDVIPVGDAFPYIVTGHSGQALDAAYAARFRAAETLYTDKLRPVLLTNYGMDAADLDVGAERPPGLVADERLAQTLLLAAVAVDVPALRGLTAARLSSLNHGSVVSPLRDGEASAVLSKVRSWSLRVPEIHVDPDPRNPVIRVNLAEVDYESVVEKAKGEDNDGRRRELVKELVLESLGVTPGAEDMLRALTLTVLWRGSRREVDLVFGNVRDRDWLTDEHFQARPGTWRFVIDHPFDYPDHSASEDLIRIDDLKARDFSEQTLVWVPRFLSDERMRDVRRLVILNQLLDGTGERWTSYADHLSEHDRVQARVILESSRSTLRRSVLNALQVAYDAAAPTGSVDVVDEPGHDRVLISLDRGFEPQRPVGATLRAAFEQLVQHAFDATYPGHPRFEPATDEVRPRELAEVLRHVERAMADPERRVPLTGDPRAVRRVANPLGVGYASETHFIFGDDRLSPWNAEFERALGRRGEITTPLMVGDLRRWISELDARVGLRPEVADLVVLAWAALKRRAWFLYGGPVPAPEPGRLKPEMELREQVLPTEEEWQRAGARSLAVFGVRAGSYLTPQEVAGVAAEIADAVRQRATSVGALVGAVADAYVELGLDPAAAGRLATARRADELLRQLRALEGVALVRRLAVPDDSSAPTEEVLGRSVVDAEAVRLALQAFRWDRLAPLRDAERGEGERAERAFAILEALRRGVEQDQYVRAVALTLSQAEEELYGWLTEVPAVSIPPVESATITTPEPVDPVGVPEQATVDLIPATLHLDAGTLRLAPDDDVLDLAAQLEDFRREHAGHALEVSWRALP